LSQGRVGPILHPDLLEDAARQTPRPLAPVIRRVQRKLEIDADDAVDGVKPEKEGVDAGAAAHLEHARAVERASPAVELAQQAP
jgi:hypothetical protein